MSRAVTLALALASCALGGLERVHYTDAAGREHMVELASGATEAEVEGRLGGPRAVQTALVGDVTYWLYTYDLSRWNYVLEFRRGRLVRVRYQPRPDSPR